jgi:hypothetical protein
VDFVAAVSCMRLCSAEDPRMLQNALHVGHSIQIFVCAKVIKAALCWVDSDGTDFRRLPSQSWNPSRSKRPLSNFPQQTTYQAC